MSNNFLVMFMVVANINTIFANSTAFSNQTTSKHLKLLKLNFLANGCIASYGPYNLECLNSIFVDVGCSEDGGLYPDRLSSSQKADYNRQTVYEIKDGFKKIQSEATNGNVEAQLNCYGLIFRDGCRSYFGVHNIDCLESMWLALGCEREGRKYPFKLSEVQIKKISSWNLREITNYIFDLQSRSSLNDVQAQLDCYGIDFFGSCATFEAPLTLECLQGIWIEKSECTSDGTLYPSLENSDILAQIWGTKNQRQALDLARKLTRDALNGDITAQESCYGIVFPPSCTVFVKDHSMECLQSIWRSVGCSLLGKSEPSRLPRREFQMLKSSTLIEIRRHFTSWYDAADDVNLGNVEAQLSCFGLLLTPKCPSFQGPLEADCLMSIWLDVGCTRDGEKAPLKLTGRQKLDEWKTYNLHDARAHAVSLFRAATENNPLKKYDCFGSEQHVMDIIVPPNECNMNDEILSDVCLDQVWREVGCKKSGQGYPFTLYDPFDYYEQWTDFTLRDAIATVDILHQNAMNGSGQDQLKCFGKVFPSNCDTFGPPIPRRCFLSLWEEQDCTVEGFRYFEATAATNNINLNTFNIIEIADFLRKLKGESVVSSDATALIFPPDVNISSQYSCFGMSLPSECIRSMGPHSVECFRRIWLNVGCLKEGEGYLEGNVRLNLDLFDEYGFEEISKYVSTLKEEADAMNTDAQINCYGFEFPGFCRFFKGPHDIDCINHIRIILGFPADPTPLSPALQEVVNNLNLIELKNLLRNGSGSLDGISQFEDEAECVSSDPPLTISCFTFIWLNAVGCKKEGKGYPPHPNASEMILQLTNLSLSEATGFFQAIKDKALGGSAPAQVQCYGLEFYDACPTFDPALPRACLNAIWLAQNCSSQGSGYPQNLNDETYASTWLNRNQREAVEVVIGIRNKSIDFDLLARQQCLGGISNLWVYMVTGATLKTVMIAFGGFLVFLCFYIIIRLAWAFPRRRKAPEVEYSVESSQLSLQSS